MLEENSKIVRIYPESFRTHSHENYSIEEHIKRLPLKNIKTVLNNPYLTEDDVVQLIGFWNEKIVGAIEYCFPLKIKVNGEIHSVSAGSTLYVDEQYRKQSGMGAFLMMEKTKVNPSRNNLASGISQMALPLYKKLKYVVFENPRMMYLKHSFSVVDHFSPLGKWLNKGLSWIIDVALNTYGSILFNAIHLGRYQCNRVQNVTDDIINIIQDDSHSCMELHDKDWWNWIMNNSLSECDAHKELFEIRENGKVVGFFLNKIAFHESASSRGFKNVNLGSVIEWGFSEASSLDEYKTQMLAIKNMPENVDAVEVISTDARVLSKFKKSLMMPVGFANMAVRLKGVQKGLWENMANWRIRLAASDVSVN